MPAKSIVDAYQRKDFSLGLYMKLQSKVNIQNERRHLISKNVTGILTTVDSDKSVQSPFRLRNYK